MREPTRDEKRLAALCALSHRAMCVLPKHKDLIHHRREVDALNEGPWRWVSPVEFVDDHRFFLVDGYVGYKAGWGILWTYDVEPKQNIN